MTFKRSGSSLVPINTVHAVQNNPHTAACRMSGSGNLFFTVLPLCLYEVKIYLPVFRLKVKGGNGKGETLVIGNQ